jgi:hypothetical protein
MSIHTKLEMDLARARKMAITASVSVEDGGSCSADFVHIPVGNDYPLKRASKRLDELTDGIRRERGIWRGYLITPPGDGRASRRLASARAMAAELSRQGWRASVYYAVD